MSTRFRPRTVDENKPLCIVRDESELDEEAKGAADGDVKVESDKPIIQIPIPPVNLVPTYNTDYLPVHTVGITYQKAPSRVEVQDKEWQEYDLDADDIDFLHDINQGSQNRLSDKQMEILIWKLETMNADATERSLAQAGATVAERSASVAASVTDHMSKAVALEQLHAMCRCQHHVIDRVYEYWKDKRKRTQRPSLRRLQAPTPESDNNPFLVFRMRAKPNRPQTRRRRETQEESLDKIRSMQQNLGEALRIAEMVRMREAKKGEMLNPMGDAWQYKIQLILGEKSPEELDKRVMAAMKMKQNAFVPISLPKPGDRIRHGKSIGPPVADQKANKTKRKRQNRPRKEAIAQLALPPEPVQPTMGFLYDLSHAEMLKNINLSLVRDDGLRQRLEDGSLALRMGRCGRICFDQVDPFTWEPLPKRVRPAAAAAAAASTSDPVPDAAEQNGHRDDEKPLCQDRLSICLMKC